MRSFAGELRPCGDRYVGEEHERRAPNLVLASGERQSGASRKQEQDEAMRRKEEMKGVPPEDMFVGGEQWSRFDEQGVPTHGAGGEALSKSLIKKLKKAWLKQKRLYESARQ